MKLAVLILVSILASCATNYTFESVDDLISDAGKGKWQAQEILAYKYLSGDEVEKNNQTAYFWITVCYAYLAYRDCIPVEFSKDLNKQQCDSLRHQAIRWIWDNDRYAYQTKRNAEKWIQEQWRRERFIMEMLHE